MITDVREIDDAYHVSAKTSDGLAACPHCHAVHIVGFGRRTQWIKDLPMHGKRVALYLDTRRFRCKVCGRTFYETLPAVDAKRLMTERLVTWVAQEALRRPFVHVAEDVGTSEGTVRQIFKEAVARWDEDRRVETPKWLGLDEIHLIRPRAVITNVQERTLVDILVNRNKDTIMRYLCHMPNRDRIAVVTMDMWRPYKEAVRAVLPHATIVVDKFHVVKMANAAVEQVRKQLRTALSPAQRRGLMHDRFILLKREAELNEREELLLSTWVQNYPILGAVHQAKEAFFDLYTATTRAHAEQRFAAWEQALSGQTRVAFGDVLTAWRNWQQEILAYFDHPVTNAYTESLNSLIRATDRMGRGYSFEVLRAKMLWAEGAIKKVPRRPKLTRQSRTLADRWPPVGNVGRPLLDDDLWEATADTVYGTDLRTLVHRIDTGTL